MARLTEALAAVGSEIARLVWPARCAACDAYVDETTAFCAACAIGVEAVSPACPGCAMPGPPELCAGCRQRPFPFARASAALLYGGPVAQAIIAFKHGGRGDLGARLAILLAPTLRAALEDIGGDTPSSPGSPLVAPVPLGDRKLRKRGFNQSLVLLLAARRLGHLRFDLRRDLLRRVRDTGELGHAGPAERRRRVAGAFALAPRADVRGRRVLLVDDVMTTGATLAECARTLLTAGAASVEVLALARAE